MPLSFCSLSSGSTGNCYLIKNESIKILLDFGISFKKAKMALEQIDTDISEIDYIFITHEHSDHVKGLGTMLKNVPDIKIIGSKKTLDNVASKFEMLYQNNFYEVREWESFNISNLKINPFPLSHDTASPISYSFETSDAKISIITDTGIIKDDVFQEIKDSNIIAIESNYDKTMLKEGPYLPHTKSRILGEKGHLSNEDCANTIVKILEENNKIECILLSHISKNNNTYEKALENILLKLIENNIPFRLDENDNSNGPLIDVLIHDKLSKIFTINKN